MARWWGTMRLHMPVLTELFVMDGSFSINRLVLADLRASRV